jgi:hypothetical protein
LFRHLNLCKSSRSRTCLVVSSRSSALSVASASSVSSRISRASSNSSAPLVSSTSSIASIEKVQLRILGQLYTVRSPTIQRSQDLSSLRKNDPLYGIPQNRQLRKTTAASPIKSTATYRQLPHPLKSTATVSTAVPPPPVEPNTPEAPPVESSAPGALDSTDDALVLFQWNRRSLNCRRSSSPSRHFKSCSTATTTAVPHTSTALTTKDPKSRPPLRNRQFSRQHHGYTWRNRLIKEKGILGK